MKRVSDDDLAEFLLRMQELLDALVKGAERAHYEPTNHRVEAPSETAAPAARRVMVKPVAGTQLGAPDDVPKKGA